MGETMVLPFVVASSPLLQTGRWFKVSMYRWERLAFGLGLGGLGAK